MTFLADALPPQTEKHWLGQVLQMAEMLGWKHYHTHRSERSAAGFPDLVLVRRPRVIFAELKSQRNRLSPPQVQWLLALRECGQEVYVWRPADHEKVYRILSRGPG